MTKRICPYPGLRPFTEEESVFFKGRDMHIRQIVKLLELNKMAFITGASGDGKSSMVYAGVVPYIRAGYFKARYNGWLIVDFKPQKNPLKSLSDSLAMQLGTDSSKCMNDLSYGFSSLVDIYRESQYYVESGDNVSNRGRNLLIIADQFEEMFTNFENFDNGQPSDESYTTVNLLLETIRISIAEKLPIYVAFTMRSDFISQCTFFKNLPEYMAYSQFFVPQLKRTEIRQVIEEPALMAGGSISPRLTEIIINNLNSGFDQLPVLQHALNLLWRMAGDGASQMDLIHLAKIAGISSDVLSADERGEFDRWKKSLPEYHHKYYEHPDLNNVLNAHAGILYESAYDYFMQNSDWAEKSITPAESKEIIETVFKSLTKIDNNRPVRNRCKLSEITGIINKPNITNATVCGVINIFRTPDNSLIKPFSVPGHTDTEYISGDTVLDVTHEALIRNWQLLSEWNLEEETDIKDYHDLNAQMQLWISNGRNSSYLLNSGSYTYFNQWFNRSNPNPSLFLKYDNSKLPVRQKMKNAQCKYDNYVEFLETSYSAILAKEKAVRRRVRIVIFSLLAFVVSLSAFAYWAMNEKSDAETQRQEAETQREIADMQRMEAEKQRQIAVAANQKAQRERDTAQLLYQSVLKAMKESERQRAIAYRMRNEADRQRQIADSNYLFAMAQRQQAENDRNALQEQIDLTEEANAKSAKFNMMAMSNLLAMKAKNPYDDKGLNLRLAMTSYNIMVNNDIDNFSEIYDALLFAMGQNNMLDPVKVTNSKLAGFAVGYDSELVCVTNNAEVITYRMINDTKTKELQKITKYQTKLPIRGAVFADPYNVIYSGADHNTYFLNVKTQERTKLTSQGDVIKSACFTPDAKYLVIAYQSGRVIVLSSNAPDGHVVQSLNLKVRLAGICANSQDIYILTQKGDLIKWSFLQDTQKTIFQQGKTASCIVSIPDKRQVAACFADGNIHFVDTKSDTEVDMMLGSHSGLLDAVYDTSSGLLMISGANKCLSIVNMRNMRAKPIQIEDHAFNRKEIMSIGFSADGQAVLSLTSDNVLRCFYLEIDTYMDRIAAKYPKPLNQEELELILGRDFLDN